MTDLDQFSGGCATSALTSNQWGRVFQTREPDDSLFSATVHLRNSAFHAAFPAALGWLSRNRAVAAVAASSSVLASTMTDLLQPLQVL